MTTYTFRPGSRFSGDADAVVVELEEIRSKTGTLQPEAVLDAAVDDASVLHRHFEWDDEAAAHEYRLETARKLIRAVVVKRAPGSEPEARYVYTERDYVPMAEVVADPGRYLLALSAARRDLESSQRRVNDLLSAAKVAKASKGDVARIMLAVQALQTANEAIQAVH
jgi:hypothetical protein